jgi:hypothetical protein
MTPDEEAAWVADRLAGKRIDDRSAPRTFTDRMLDVINGTDWQTAREVVEAMGLTAGANRIISTRLSQMWAQGYLERASTKDAGLFRYRRAS